MKTRAERSPTATGLTGSKMWNSNAPFADASGVGKIRRGTTTISRGFNPREGMKACGAKIGASSRWRARSPARIVMDGVVVPEDALLPNVSA